MRRCALFPLCRPVAVNSEFGRLLCGPLTSTRDCYFNDNGNVGTHLVISGGMNQFNSPNEEIIDAFMTFGVVTLRYLVRIMRRHLKMRVMLHLTEGVMKLVSFET